MKEELLKLTNAVYKILEFFPESDPLKNRAKDKALAIMDNPTVEDIDMLLGYLWIAKNQGWLSAANCLIVFNEYEKLKKQIQPSAKLTKAPLEPELNTSSNLTDRQKKIIEFLKKNEKAQVVDLQQILPQITKRTIRRDLDELLGAGKIVRMGEFNQVFYLLKQG